MQKWKQAEKNFKEHFDQYGKRAWVFRLTDTATAKATSGKRAFVVAQPSDFLVVFEGNVFFAEVKSTKDQDRFHFSNIRKHQLAASRRITAAGGTYLFFVWTEELEQWYAIPAAVIHNTMKTKKNLSWKELEAYKYEL